MSDPERTCIVTRTEHPKEELLRFVVSPDGLLVADLAHKLPGRGVYVTCSKLLVAEALAKRLFGRALKEQVGIPDGFLERLTGLMQARVQEALSMARKGGLVLSGFEKVEEALKADELAALIHASDAGEDGKKKFQHLLRALEEEENIPIYDFLSRETLGNLLAKDNAVHVGVAKGSAAAFFLSEARRFALFLE